MTQAVVSPFLEDVAENMQRADIVVARAGASTVAEICASGRASVLVPFPFAADDHQWENANALALAGGCVAIRQPKDVSTLATRLKEELVRLLADDSARHALARKAEARGRPESATDVARDLLTL
jgi:UDP-N-acetylglucosamine--N-acetylmuramyl-(pentapeptide) pyrophosphoryl-undecaprenol N-acetylglucosamine transferase